MKFVMKSSKVGKIYMNSIFIKTIAIGTTAKDGEGKFIYCNLYSMYIMRRIIQNHGPSKCIGIPLEIVEDLNLKAGDKLDFVLKNGKMIVTPVRPKT